MTVGPLIVNQLYPPRFVTGASARAVASLPESVRDEVLDPLLTTARTEQRRRELNDRYLTRLREAIPVAQVQLPFLFVPELGPTALDDLSQRLEGQIAAS
jgi:hypothetical protein